MKNCHSYYNDLTEQELAENEHFREWVLYNERDKEDFWNRYLQLYPHRKETILIATEKVKASLRLQSIQPLTVREKSILKLSIYGQINQPFTVPSMFRKRSRQVLKFAAVVTGITLVSFFFLQKKPPVLTLIVKHTGIEEIKKIWLPDSSLVILNANSSITYDSEIGTRENREIELQGNAYFNVKKKADRRSFTVHANSLSIAVLGTEFNVNARSKAASVVLATGKVKLSLDGSKSAMYMNPGEKVQLDTLNNTFKKIKANTLWYTAWTKGKWNFSSTSLLDITNLIYEYYGIETVYENEKAKKLMISAVIPVTNLRSFTNILAKTLDLKITAYNNQLHIQF